MRISINYSRENVWAFFIAMTPFLVNYNVPLIQVNITVILFLYITLIKIIEEKRNKKGFIPIRCVGNSMVFGMALYIVFNHIFLSFRDTPNLLFGSILFTIILSFAEIYGLMLAFENPEMRQKYRIHLERITLFMSICIYLQYILYYGFGILPGGPSRQFLLPFPGLFTPSVAHSSSVGTMIINGLFRPSAFFLEPAHFSHYCMIGLISMLARNRNMVNWKIVTVTIAIILTTSGIGIGAVFFIYGVIFLYNFRGLLKKVIIKQLLIGAALLITFAVLFFYFPFFQQAVGRMFGVGGDNALMGRLGNWKRIRDLSGIWKWLGMGYKNLPTYGEYNNTYYFTGILEMFYCQGIIGGMFFLSFYAGMMRTMYKADDRLGVLVLLAGIIFITGASILSPSNIIRYIPFLYSYETKDKQLIKSISEKRGTLRRIQETKEKKCGMLL